MKPLAVKSGDPGTQEGTGLSHFVTEGSAGRRLRLKAQDWRGLPSRAQTLGLFFSEEGGAALLALSEPCKLRGVPQGRWHRHTPQRVSVPEPKTEAPQRLTTNAQPSGSPDTAAGIEPAAPPLGSGAGPAGASPSGPLGRLGTASQTQGSRPEPGVPPTALRWPIGGRDGKIFACRRAAANGR